MVVVMVVVMLAMVVVVIMVGMAMGELEVVRLVRWSGQFDLGDLMFKCSLAHL